MNETTEYYAEIKARCGEHMYTLKILSDAWNLISSAMFFQNQEAYHGLNHFAQRVLKDYDSPESHLNFSTVLRELRMCEPSHYLNEYLLIKTIEEVEGSKERLEEMARSTKA